MPLNLKDHEKRIQELEKTVALLKVRLDEIGPQNARKPKETEGTTFKFR